MIGHSLGRTESRIHRFTDTHPARWGLQVIVTAYTRNGQRQQEQQVPPPYSPNTMYATPLPQARQSQITGLGYAPYCYVLYGVEYIDPVSLDATGPSISNLYIAPFFFKMACKQNLDLRCVLISDPSTLGAGAKTRLHTPNAVTYHEQPQYCRFMIGHSLVRTESRIKKFTPHCVCRPL